MPVAALSAPLGTGNAALVRLCAAGFVAYLSYAICRSPLLPLFARELGAGPADIGVIVAASTLTGVVVKLPAGALSDHLGRHRLLLAGSLVFAVMPLTYLWAASLGVLVALRFVHGNATAIFGPVASAAVSDLAPPGRRGAWLSTYATAQGAGQAIGPLLAGSAIAAGRFDLAFMASAGVGLLVPVLLLRWPDPDAAVRQPLDWAAFRTGLRAVAGHRLILATSGAHAAQFVLSGALNAFLPLYARDVVGMTAAEIGGLFAMQTVTTLAIRPVIGTWSDRVGRRRVIVAGLVLCSAMVVLLARTTAPWAVVAIVATYAAGVATTTAATSAFITDVARRERYGAAHGVFGTIYDVGDALGPIAAGLLIAAAGYGVAFSVLAAVGATMAGLFALVSRSSPQPA